MFKQKHLHIITLLVLTLAITACGWRLRGTLTLPEGLESIQIVDNANSSFLSKQLTQLLVANGVALVDANPDMFIVLIEEREDKRIIAVGSNTLASEYELSSEARYFINDAEGKMLAPESTVSVVRSYEFNENDVVSKAEEERIIQQEMRRELAQQIIRRLRFVSITPEDEKTTNP
ncbi:hypothetical protein NBRC116493_30480 [Aurantivibrio infirmus]